MTEEVKNAEVKQECFCKKRLNDVIVVALGTFIGVYCALNLFTALHRPNIPCPMMGYGMHPGMMMHNQMGRFQKPPIRQTFAPEHFKAKFAKEKPAEVAE